MKIARTSLLTACPLFFLMLCALPARAEEPALVRVPAAQAPSFTDDGDLGGLVRALGSSLEYYRALPPDGRFAFGADTYTARDLVASLQDLAAFLSRSPSAQALDGHIREHFLIYRARNAAPPATIIFSSYHEYSLPAAPAPDPEYRYPLYARPKDLVDVPLEAFDPRRKGERIVGRVEGISLVPYYTREEIESGGRLAGRGLEVAWARDPLDIVFLQIQGSGWIRVPGSTQTYHVRYAGDNGRPFKSIGQTLIESGAIRKQDFSRGAMKSYLDGLSAEDRQAVFNRNPRFIFFEVVSATNSTRGSLLVPLTAGRSLAVDPRLYPQGALAWIATQRPKFGRRGEAAGTAPLQRFAFSQDEGGAIKGAGRIDYFAGGGPEAERMAQKLWFPGELYFFVKKPAGP